MSLLKKIETSELFVVMFALPVATIFAFGTNVNIHQVISEPTPPIITQLVAHPNIRAISIYGTSAYPNQTLYLEDRLLETEAYHGGFFIRQASASHPPTSETAVAVKTDNEGNFIAPIPNEHPYSDPGLHSIAAYFIIQDDDRLLSSFVAPFRITEDGLAEAVDGTPASVVISTKEISEEELRNLQSQYAFEWISQTGSTPQYLEVPQMNTVIDVWEVAVTQIITVLLFIIVAIAFFFRYLRKEKAGLPFWHIGKGIYKKS